jgi:hypothetical protein
MIRSLLAGLFCICVTTAAYSQDVTSKDFFVNGEVLFNDSIPVYVMPEIEILGKYSSKYKRKIRQYDKLVVKVKRVWPFAVLLEERLDYLDKKLASMTSESQRKAFIKQEEKLLFIQFEKEIRKLTISEGLILIKLIDRQTGNTSFELIKELRGSITAYFWQSIARVFGNDLKSKYDPVNEDRMIEDIVRRIKEGEI